MSKRYTTDEVVAMMSAPSPNVEMLEQPASPFLDPAQINAAERELSQPPPEYPRPETVGTAITDAAGMERPAAGSSGNMALQNYEAQEAFPIDQTPAPQRPAGGSQTLYPSAQETKPSLPKQRYTTDEVMSLYMQQSKPRYSTKDVMLKMVQPLDDPTMPRLGRDEYFKAKEIKKSLQESGDLPSNWEETKTAVGGFLLTIPDAFATALYKTDKSQGWIEIGGAGFNPALALSETWRRSPATLAYASEMARQGYAGMAEGLRVMGGPKYRVAESGEFVMDDEESAGGQFGQMDPRNIVDRYKAKGLTLRPVNDEDKKDFEYQQWNKKMDRDLQVERARTAEMPPEFAYRMLVGSAAAVSDYNTGRNDFANITGNVGPMQSQAVVGSMLVDPLTYTTFGAAATRIGISAAARGATARSLNIIGRAVNKAVKPAEVPLTQIDRFRKIVMPPAKVAGAYGLATGAAYAADVMQLPPELKTAAYTAAGLYTAYRGGLGVLRFVGKRFPEASVILRESADPTNGLDIAARKVVATNPNVPSNVRARLERPSQFLSMESTPQRLSQNMALSPGTRKVMEKLSNWYVVQGVRGASDMATGAVKGTIVAAPFAELTRLGGDERAADAMYGIGPALGALGGAANRVFGARGRTIGRAESDIGRMLVDVQAGNKELRSKIGADGKAALQSWNFYNTEIGRMLTDVELAAGDVDALVKNRSFDELARIAAMQGFFRSKVDYIPLGAADFALNADQHGADGSAGFFLSVPDSERARIFVNVDARRADVEPHEFGEAFFSTGAFSPEQVAAMRSGVDARYGLDGVQRRANEYAESLIKASNATNFPNEKLVVSAEQIQAKVNELAQAELQRGGNDPLDWVRREIMVEEWRMAGMDFASIRRNIPEGANPVKFIEDVLGANARALGLSGVRVDPETGIPITPEQLFRENPVAADDPVVMSNLKAYTKAYRAWLNDPAHEVPSGVKIAPDGRAESLANNPSVIFDANGQNPLATRDPQTGQVRWKNDKDRAKDAKVRGQQIRNVAGRDLVAPGSPQFGPKKTANGRIRISGRRLPAALELQNHWKPQLEKIRRLEALADGDESTQVLYVAMGNSADKVKTSRPQDIVAINREMVFDEWVVQGKNNDLYGQFLDLTTIRNRAMKAIAARNPALDPANGGPGYSLKAVMDDVFQWMDDKRAGKAGEATIGADRKNVVNALINPGTNFNREKNPIAGAFGRGSAIKTLLVDNIMAVSGTGRKGAAMDYNWANGNFMPDKPAPRPDMEGDLAPPRPQMMPDSRSERADIPLNPRARQAAFISDRGEVRSTGRATHFETNEDLGPDFLAIGAGHLGEDGFFRFGSQTMDDAMGESPATSAAAAARYNQSVYDQGKRPSAMLEEPPGLERPGGRGQTGQAMPDAEARSGAAETLDQLKRSQFIPTKVAAEVVGGFPEYLRPVAQFITDQRQKLAGGQMTRRDVMKAYAMTVASQGSGARAVEVIANNVAKDGVRFRPSKDFTTVDKQGRAAIRPEEAAAYWLGTDAGQRALDNFEAGRFSPDDWKELVAIRKAYGDDRFNNLGAFNPENIRTMDKVLADLNASRADTGKVMDAVQQLRGIKTGKKGFIAHLLGIGDVPTIDAVEINFWLTGKADIGKLNTRRANLARNIKNSISDRRVSQEMFRRIDQRINALRDEVPGGAEIAPEVWSHVMHHWLWDKSKGIETTHEGMYRAQAQFMPDSVVSDEGGTVWREIQDTPVVSLKDFEGRKVFAAFADLTSAGKIYRGIDSSEVAIPIETHGGPEWPMIQNEAVGEETNVWANEGKGIATKKLQRANEGAIMLIAAQHKNAHVSNTETATAVIATNAAYAKDGRITLENLATIDNTIRKDIPNFPGIEATSVMEFVNTLPFQGKKSRARIAEILESADMQKLGTPNVQRILDEMRSSEYDGLRIGDAVIAIELTPGSSRVTLGEQGTLPHPSYKYALRGRLIGRFARPINIESIFDDFYAGRRAEGKPTLGDRRAFDLAKPVQVITPAIAARVPGTPYNSFRSPRHAQIIKMALDDKWRSSADAVGKGGVSPAALVDALNASPAKLALDRYTQDSLKAKIKTGEMSIHQLGDSQVFFGIKQGDPASAYGQDPAAFGFGPDEKTLSLVLNNERRTGGMADAIVMKSLQLGVTALDCFAVKSKKNPTGMLPELYENYGFERAGTVPFDPQYYSKTELADLKKYWKSTGWDDSLGLPEIVLMKWKGNNELRTKSLREFAAENSASVQEAVGGRELYTDTRKLAQRNAGKGSKAQRRAGQGDAGSSAGNQGNAGRGVRLSRGFLGAHDELLSLSPDELRNLGIK